MIHHNDPRVPANIILNNVYFIEKICLLTSDLFVLNKQNEPAPVSTAICPRASPLLLSSYFALELDRGAWLG